MMDLMKRTIFSLTVLASLSACLNLGGGSSSPTATGATVAPIDEGEDIGGSPGGPATTPTPTPTPTPAPSDPFEYADITGQTVTFSGSSIAFAGNQITDIRCGGTYTITSASAVNDVITVDVALVQGSYTYPGNDDCAVTFTNTQHTSHSYNPGGGCSIIQDTLRHAERIVYTITQHAGGLSIFRDLYTRQLKRNCVGTIVYSAEHDTLTDEVYQ
jgi:hypothetical protein